MDPEVRAIIRGAVKALITEASSEREITRKYQLHLKKTHFVPLKYRILGGLLQALNIKFGNFIEQLIALVIEYDSNVEALEESGQKLKLGITPETNAIIEAYIRSRQLPDSDDVFDKDFEVLQQQIIELEQHATDAERQFIRNDLDAVFRVTETGQIVYLEIKYNDDHDTGKFESINRKFLKTYAGLVSRFNIQSVPQLLPIIYYFNPSKRYSPQYTRASNILRGAQLFDRFFETTYKEIDAQLGHIGEDPEIIALFDEVQMNVWKYVDNQGNDNDL